MKNGGDYITFTPLLSSSQKLALEEMSIGKTTEYNNFGNLSHLFPDIVNFIKYLGNRNEIGEIVGHLISIFTQEILSAFKVETAWISVRSFKRSKDFHDSRWHFDGNYFLPFEGKNYKVLLTLKGPGTLFCQISTEQKQDFFNCEDQSKLKFRDALDEAVSHLITKGAIHQTKSQTGAIITVGSPQEATIHSEPSLDFDRLFLSILPGSYSQIQDLFNRWYPK